MIISINISWLVQGGGVSPSAGARRLRYIYRSTVIHKLISVGPGVPLEDLGIFIVRLPFNNLSLSAQVCPAGT